MLAVRRCWDALGLSGRPCGAVRLLACLTGDLAKGGEGCPVAGRLVSAVSCIVALALGCAAVLRLVGLRAWRCRRRHPPPSVGVIISKIGRRNSIYTIPPTVFQVVPPVYAVRQQPKINRPPACTYLLYVVLDQYYLYRHSCLPDSSGAQPLAFTR